MPNIARETATFTTLQPGVTPTGNVAGGTTDQATFILDGGNNTFDMDGTGSAYTVSFAASTTGGFLGAAQQGALPMPQDSIEEFKVGTTGQTADFNNSSGSETQAVTKRGRDKWNGSVYEYYLDNNFNGNTWQNNFPSEKFTATTPGVGLAGTTSYTAKPSYHYSRFGLAGGGPILPKYFGGKTYLFAMFEGFRYPQAAIYERTVPSYEYLQLGQLTFGANTYSAAQLKAADPRGIGMDPTLANTYNTELPVAPAGDGGSTGFNGANTPASSTTAAAHSRHPIATARTPSVIKPTVFTPESSNFLVARVDHDFGAKWHLMASYRFYRLTNITSNQVDIGGVLPGDKIGVPTAVSSSPPGTLVLRRGLTTNISSSLTNDFHYSFLRNYWNWKDANAPRTDCRRGRRGRAPGRVHNDRSLSVQRQCAEHTSPYLGRQGQFLQR